MDHDGREYYNALGEVEDAYRELSNRERSFDDFLDAFSALAYRHAVAGYVGAFLLHRHFRLADREVLVEAPATLAGGRPALIAAPSATAEKVGAPVRWAFVNDQAVALEFSRDIACDEQWRGLSGSAQFISDLANLVYTYELAHLVGLCVTERAHLQRGDKQQYIERTFREGSVVTLDAVSDAAPQFIPTAWSPRINMKCRSNARCMSLCSTGASGHQKTGHMPYHGYEAD
jgi:hypothetical protein